MIFRAVLFSFSIQQFLWIQPTSGQNSITLDVEHRFGSQNSPFLPRGVIKLNTQGDHDVQFKSSASWSIADQLTAASSDSSYCVRIKAQPLNLHSTEYVHSCLPACLLVLSELNDVLTLSMDSNRQHVVGISVQTTPISSNLNYLMTPIHFQQENKKNEEQESVVNNNNNKNTNTNAKINEEAHYQHDQKAYHICRNLQESALQSTRFNTTIRLVEPIEGPVPETQAYLQKLEREKQEKTQGEQGDNRSFIAKYWMYIVPVVVLVMLSGAMNPEGQQQGR